MRAVSKGFGFSVKSASLTVDVLTLPGVHLCEIFQKTPAKGRAL